MQLDALQTNGDRVQGTLRRAVLEILVVGRNHFQRVEPPRLEMRDSWLKTLGLVGFRFRIKNARPYG